MLFSELALHEKRRSYALAAMVVAIGFMPRD